MFPQTNRIAMKRINLYILTRTLLTDRLSLGTLFFYKNANTYIILRMHEIEHQEH